MKPLNTGAINAAAICIIIQAVVGLALMVLFVLIPTVLVLAGGN